MFRRILIYPILLLCALVLCTSTLYAASVIDSSTTRYSLGKDLLYLKEEGRALSLSDILQPAFQNKFKKSDKNIPNFGIADESYWAKISIDYRGDQHIEWLIELDYIYLDKIEFYSRDHSDKFKLIKTGDTFAFDEREIKLQSFIFPIDLKPSVINDIYVRITTTTTLQMPFLLWQDHSFTESIANQRFWYGLFYGAMFIMLFYNTMVYLSVRDPCYLYYLGYILAHIMSQLAINGLGFEKVWPGSPEFQNMSIPIFMGITNTLALLFARSFLLIWKNQPRVDLTLKIMIIIGMISCILPLFASQASAFKIAILIAIIFMVSLLSIGFYGVLKGQRRAYYFTSAWLALCLGIIFKSMNALDWLPTNFITAYGAQIGAVVEAVLLAFALADRINTDRREKLEAMTLALKASDEQLSIKKKLIYQSFYDQLTLMPNRDLLIKELGRIIYGADRDKDSFCLVCIHVNNFHDINYTLGHEVGDSLLRRIADELNIEVNKWPKPFAIGKDPDTGQEKYLAVREGVYFFIIYPNIDENALSQVLKRLAVFLEKPISLPDLTLDIGGHIGVANWPTHSDDAENLIRKSMMAVRAAKWANRTELVYSQSIDHYSARRLSLMGEMKQAIDNQELEVYFHPKIDIQSNNVVSMEALLRWRHPKYGMLQPGEFVELAEGTRIIHPLTLYVLETSVRHCSQLVKDGLYVTVAVNVSARNLIEEGFTRSVIKILRKYKFDPGQLIIEVLESSLIEDMDNTITTLKNLESSGIKISLDDFGTGYSSLAYLKRLPVHEIKIDRSFVKDMTDNHEDRLIVESTLAIAHELGLRVVAEGVESKSTLDLLVKMGCDLAQGFYFSRPMDIDHLKTWFANRNKYKR